MAGEIKNRIIDFLKDFETSRKERYILGIADFSEKLSQLTIALKDEEEGQIRFLLHSLKPLSQLLNLSELNLLLHSISKDHNTDYSEIILLLESKIQEIDTTLNSLH
ncbi:MAG TPA: hypothetical protein PKO18_03725 [Chitinophagales bacterium]|nr:hypothetical protein [Chitinophagales bacterium]HNL84323.1 hypothetical protein [Chitinophagales bacterium]